jgi:hypothetical protein
LKSIIMIMLSSCGCHHVRLRVCLGSLGRNLAQVFAVGIADVRAPVNLCLSCRGEQRLPEEQPGCALPGL